MEIPWDKIFTFVTSLVAMLLCFYAMVWGFISPETFLIVTVGILAAFGIGITGAQLRRDAYRAGVTEGLTLAVLKKKDEK